VPRWLAVRADAARHARHAAPGRIPARACNAEGTDTVTLRLKGRGFVQSEVTTCRSWVLQVVTSWVHRKYACGRWLINDQRANRILRRAA
jgi:hypothetical protein